MVITKMFSFYFFQSVTLEIRVATPFLIGSVEILRDYRHFSKKNCFRLFFLGGGRGEDWYQNNLHGWSMGIFCNNWMGKKTTMT